MSWQPTETAPRDGTRVLLFSRQHKNICIGYWKAAWWLCQGSGDAFSASSWMPLPEPPEN